MRSCWKVGLTATVVVVQRWLGSRVTLILSLTGKIRVSSLFPQYLMTAMLVGVCAVTISTQLCNSLAISSTPKKPTNQTIEFNQKDKSHTDCKRKIWIRGIRVFPGNFKSRRKQREKRKGRKWEVKKWVLAVIKSWERDLIPVCDLNVML